MPLKKLYCSDKKAIQTSTATIQRNQSTIHSLY